MRRGLTPAWHATSSRVRAVVKVSCLFFLCRSSVARERLSGMVRRDLSGLAVAAVCMVLVGCGSGTGTSGTVARQPKTCAQLRRQAEAKQGKGGNFECLVKGGKVEGRYSTGELKFPSE